MTIAELIALCQRRIDYLQSVRASALGLGDSAQAEKVDIEVAQTQTTLNLLRTLPG